MHIPVLLNTVIGYMSPRDRGTYLDATAGEGGHARAILEASGPAGYVVCSDADSTMLETAKKNLLEFGARTTFLHENYRDLDAIVRETGIERFDGIILDLGFNSAQIGNALRGFSFSNDGPLDMRYDTSSGMTAEDVVNTYGQEKLAQIIHEYGEDRHARRIAKAIVVARKKARIRSTAELASIVARVSGGGHGIHPATRTFQALRIAVNDELGNLKAFLEKAGEVLAVGGVLVIISFHSLEDRIVKQAFRQLALLTGPVFKILTRKPVLPGPEELRNNTRARSARLRALQRIAEEDHR